MMDRKHPSPAQRVTSLVAALAASLLAFAEPASADFLNIQLRGTMQVTSYACDPNGVSTIEFTASGNSILSYPGSFVASGAFTIGAQNQPGYPDNNFRPVGQILTWSGRGHRLAQRTVRDALDQDGRTSFRVRDHRRQDQYGTCAFVDNVTLSSVRDTTGTVIEAYGTVGMREASSTLPSDAFASSIAVEC